MYTELLAEEIENMVDDIALNIIPPPNISIYNSAVKNLEEHINYSTSRSLPLVYNFGVQIALFIYKNQTYIKLVMNNERLGKSITNIPELEEYSLFDSDDRKNKERSAVWQEIFEIYSNGNNPLVKQLLPSENPIIPEWKNISAKFHSREQRADVRVRHKVTSTLLNMIGMEKEIPPYKLLPYLDEAMEMLFNSGIKSDINQMKTNVLQSIVNITEESVKRDPAAHVNNCFISQEQNN